MKSVKIQWSIVTFAVLFSCFAQAMNDDFSFDEQSPAPVLPSNSMFVSHFADTKSESSVQDTIGTQEYVVITQKINKIIRQISSEDNEFEELNYHDLIFAQNVEVNTEKMAEVLDWFKAYVKMERQLIQENDNNKFRLAIFGYGTLALFSALTFDPWSAVYAGPAAYSAYRVLAPELTKELQALTKKKIKNCPENFSSMISDESPQFKQIVKIAEEFYRNRNNAQSCQYRNFASHCQAQEILNQPWYLRLLPCDSEKMQSFLRQIPVVQKYVPASKPVKGKKK